MKFTISLLAFNLVSLISGNPVESQSELRLIKTSESEAPNWLNEDQILDLIKKHQGFFDVTDQEELPRFAPNIDNFAIPTALKYQTQTKKAQGLLSPQRAEQFLNKLVTYHTRYYTTKTGVDAAYFIKDYASQIASKYTGAISVQAYNHTWAQPSVIVNIKGTQNPDEIVVLGAHLDSINQNNPTNGRSPGADDDGSGVITLLEAFQGLVESGFKPKRTIEFQFYAAEEVGLRGSQAIATAYKNSGKKVVAMLQQDMTGYKPSTTKTIRVMTDFVDKQLTQFLKLLITSYTPYPVNEDSCGYACSDHASYNKAGFRAAISSEPVLARGYHTERDVITDVNFQYLNEFSKVAAGFAIELAEPSA